MQVPTSAASAPSPLPKSSLIICSRNRPALLSDTVTSILSADEVPTEILLVDQSDSSHPTLGSLTTQRDCEIRYLWTQTIGSSVARNAGIAAARQEIVAFIDDDMWVTPDWYGELIRPVIKAGPRTVVTGRVMPAPSERPDGFVAALHTWEEPRTYVGRIGRDILATGHMAMYRSAFAVVGGLDQRLGPGTRFPGAEDNDLGFRLLEAGYRILYLPGSIILHRAWRGRGDYLPLYWKYGRGQGAFYAKHLGFRDRYMLERVNQDVSRYLRLLPQRVLRQQLLELSGSTAFIVGTFLGAAEWWLTQREAPT